MCNGKPAKKGLIQLQKALSNAVEEGRISKEAYDTIIAVTPEKMAKKNKKASSFWGQPVAQEEEPTPPSPPPEPTSYATPDEPKPAPEPEPEPEPVLGYDEAPPTIEATEEPEGQRETNADEGHATNSDREDAADATVNAIADEEGKQGFLLTWCLRCARIDVVQYESKSLPDSVRGGTEPPLKNGIVVIACGTCKPEGEWRDGFGKASWTDGSRKETEMRSALETLKMNPAILSGSEVAKVARVVTSCDVAFITDNGRVGYREIDKIVKGLTSKDRLMSIDREGLAEGKEGRVLLPYLAGGLTSL